MVYAHRPDVCRACEPGDDACSMARRRFGLAELPQRPGAEPGSEPQPTGTGSAGSSDKTLKSSRTLTISL